MEYLLGYWLIGMTLIAYVFWDYRSEESELTQTSKLMAGLNTIAFVCVAFFWPVLLVRAARKLKAWYRNRE